MSSLMLTLDGEQFRAKPNSKDAAAITRRMQDAGPSECDETAFCEAVRRGRTWCGGCYAPAQGRWGRFIGQQVFALDFDNKDAASGLVSPVAALDRCETFGLEPLCLYFTMSAHAPDAVRFRLVFDMGEPLDQDAARAVIASLLSAFPESDQACKNSNRLFYGSNGEVWETWRIWGRS